MTDKIPPNIFAKIPPNFQNYIKAFEDELKKNPILHTIEAKAKVPPLFLVLGVGLVVFILLAFNIGGELISNLIGFAYPAFASLTAIESATAKDETRFWLSYWIVFALLNVIEFIDLSFIPLYYIFRLAFIVWLFAPQTKGAAIIDKNVFSKLWKKPPTHTQ